MPPEPPAGPAGPRHAAAPANRPAAGPPAAAPPAAGDLGGVVFDLDGTLIDSRRDIASAVNSMRAERDLGPLSVDEVSAMVGEGARMLVRRALPAVTGKDELREALASYLAHYAEVCLETTRPYPGIAAMLATLAPSFALAVLSNKGEALSRRILQELGLGRYLREVVGGDTLPTRKPNPGGLFLLADRLAVPPPRLLVVGDTWIDAETAQAAGSPFALTVWGGPHVASEGIAAPNWRLAHPRELPAVLGLPEEGEEGEAAGRAGRGEGGAVL